MSIRSMAYCVLMQSINKGVLRVRTPDYLMMIFSRPCPTRMAECGWGMLEGLESVERVQRDRERGSPSPILSEIIGKRVRAKPNGRTAGARLIFHCINSTVGMDSFDLRDFLSSN